MHCIKFISILLLLILNSCSNDKKISENYIENKDLETEMIKAYNEGMSALEKGDAFYAAKNLVKQSYYIHNLHGHPGHHLCQLILIGLSNIIMIV